MRIETVKQLIEKISTVIVGSTTDQFYITSRHALDPKNSESIDEPVILVYTGRRSVVAANKVSKLMKVIKRVPTEKHLSNMQVYEGVSFIGVKDAMIFMLTQPETKGFNPFLNHQCIDVKDVSKIPHVFKDLRETYGNVKSFIDLGGTYFILNPDTDGVIWSCDAEGVIRIYELCDYIKYFHDHVTIMGHSFPYCTQPPEEVKHDNPQSKKERWELFARKHGF